MKYYNQIGDINYNQIGDIDCSKALLCAALALAGSMMKRFTVELKALNRQIQAAGSQCGFRLHHHGLNLVKWAIPLTGRVNNENGSLFTPNEP